MTKTMQTIWNHVRSGGRRLATLVTENAGLTAVAMVVVLPTLLWWISHG